MPTVQRLQHTSIPMPQGGQEAARAFYGQALGMEEVLPPSTLDRSCLVWFRAGQDGHEVHLFVEDPAATNSNAQHLCLQVDDIDAYRSQVAEHGIAVEETTPIHNRPRFFVRDPFTNLVELTQITGDYQ
jgi:catechol 2,3-dioxygenase-like lactoylglutathione lyase family enzyme